MIRSNDKMTAVQVRFEMLHCIPKSSQLLVCCAIAFLRLIGFGFLRLVSASKVLTIFNLVSSINAFNISFSLIFIKLTNMTYPERGFGKTRNFYKNISRRYLSIFSERNLDFRRKFMNLSVEDFKDYTII